jgi:hypothetical protein
MKRKKELTPCEEKALVHLQALQIKEKEAKAKQRAKKRKVNTAVAGRSIALAGQNLPFQPEPIVNPKDTRPFYPIQNPLPTRNEWNQLIPAAAQTAQFMLLNHAMQQQGIKKDTERTTQTQPSPPTGPKVGSGKSKKKSAKMDIEILPDEDKISRFRRTGPFIPNAPPPVAPEEELEVPNLIMSDERRAKAEQLLKRISDRGLGSYKRAGFTLKRQAFDKLRDYRRPLSNLLDNNLLDKDAIEAFFKPPASSDERRAKAEQLLKRISDRGLGSYKRAGFALKRQAFDKLRDYRRPLSNLLDNNLLDKDALEAFFKPPASSDEWPAFEWPAANPPEQPPRAPPQNIPRLPPITIPRAPPLTIPQAPLDEEKEAPKLVMPDEDKISRFRRTGPFIPNAPVAPEELEAPKLIMSDERRAKAEQLLKRSLDRGLGSNKRARQTLQSQVFDKLQNYPGPPAKPITLTDLLNAWIPVDNSSINRNEAKITQDFFTANPLPNLIKTEPPEEKKELEEEKDPRKMIKEYLKTVPQPDKEAFLQKYGYEMDLHDSFVKYHQIAPAKLDFTPEEQDIFQEQYQNWKAVNIDKPPAIENMTPKTNIREFLATAPANTFAEPVNLMPFTPPKDPVAPVSDAQKMLTPPQLNQYPGWNRKNVSTPLRQSGLAQQAIEMSNMLNNINNPWVPPSYKLPTQFNYNHPTNVAIRAQAKANSQFFKQNELFSQKYVIPRNPNAMRYNMYPLQLQRVLRTHFPMDISMRNSVAFNKEQVEAIRGATNETLADTVDYYLSENYPKQNQQLIPDVPVNESSGMQPLEIEDNANIPELSDNFGSGFDNPNITTEIENVGTSFVGE